MKRNLDLSEDSIEELLSAGDVELSDINFQSHGREDVFRPSGQVEQFERNLDRVLIEEQRVEDYLNALSDIDHDYDFDDVEWEEEEA